MKLITLSSSIVEDEFDFQFAYRERTHKGVDHEVRLRLQTKADNDT